MLSSLGWCSCVKYFLKIITNFGMKAINSNSCFKDVKSILKYENKKNLKYT